MKIIIKRLALVLTLSLCFLPINAALALAETGTTEVTEASQELADVTDTTTNEETTTTESTDTETTVDTGVPTDTTTTTTDTTTDTPTPTDPDTETSSDADVNVNGDTALPPVLDENGDVVDPGTLPDSPFYWLTMLIEKLQVILTVDPVEKTALLEEQALERIAEAQELIETGDTEVAEEALQAYSAKVAEAQAFLEKLSETDSETTQKLETALSQSHANNIQTLGGLLDKLPPQASEKVALNIVRSMEKSIAKMDKKEQQRVAKELRKATQGLEDTELTEEDQEALETLEALEPQDDELEEITTVSDTTLTTMAITTNTLATAKLQEQKENLKENLKEAETEKVQEQKQRAAKEKLASEDQEDQVSADQENDLEQNDSTLDNSVQKENGNQQREQKASEKSKQSGGKGKN